MGSRQRKEDEARGKNSCSRARTAATARVDVASLTRAAAPRSRTRCCSSRPTIWSRRLTSIISAVASLCSRQSWDICSTATSSAFSQSQYTGPASSTSEPTSYPGGSKTSPTCSFGPTSSRRLTVAGDRTASIYLPIGSIDRPAGTAHGGQTLTQSSDGLLFPHRAARVIPGGSDPDCCKARKRASDDHPRRSAVADQTVVA